MWPGRSVIHCDALAEDKKLYFGTNFMLGAEWCRVVQSWQDISNQSRVRLHR